MDDASDLVEAVTDAPCQTSPQAPGAGRSAALRARTQDVLSDATSFRELMVSETLVRSLSMAGFERPSPVQKAAIPLGRVGTDLIVQAKSGTGKTVVFAVICLERVKAEQSSTQALILAPTREIAIQSEQVIRTLASELPAPAATSGVFVGGLSMVEDEKKLRRLCHIAVGTPGRVCALLQSGRLAGAGLSLLVLDEADSLLGESFYEDVTWVYDQLPKRKQVLAFSATYTPELLADLEPLMRRPQRVMMCAESVSLLGVRQFYCLVEAGEAGEAAAAAAAGREEGEVAGAAAASSSSAAPAVFRRKVQQLLRLLGGASFHQAAVFCNHKPRAEWLAAQLSAAGYPAAYLSADRAQAERMEAMQAVRGFKLRVVVSTDVMARGVDLERVNLVVNLDLPYDAATYMHRVGRTGRFGSRGVCVSYVTQAELALLVSYVDEQAAAAAAATAAAAAAETTNGGGGQAAASSGEGGGGEGAETVADAATGSGAASGGAEVVLLPLPERIPEDLYGYDLGSDWERQAWQQLVQRERRARQELLEKQQTGAGVQAAGSSAGAAAGVPGGAVGEDGVAAGSEKDGQVKGVAVELAAVPLPELPPLPEEVKAAKKAEQAARAAAEKAEKELRKQQQQRIEQEEQGAQQQQAYWDAYGYGGYNYGAYGGYGGYAPSSYPADPAGGASSSGRTSDAAYTSDPWAAYWRGYQHSPYPGATQPSYGAYPGYSQQGHAGEASSSQDAHAAAWAQYYAQWQPQQQPYSYPWSTSAAGAAAPSSACAPGWGVPGASASAGASRGAGARAPTAAAGVQAKGAGGGVGAARVGDEDGSELSFGALRGEPVVSGAEAVPAVLHGACGRRNPGGSSAASGAAPSGAALPVARAAAVEQQQQRVPDEAGEEEGYDGGEEEGEEDESWVLEEGDLAEGVASIIDKLVVLLPPSGDGSTPTADLGAVPASHGAEGAGVSSRGAAPAAAAADGDDAAAAALGGDAAGSSAPYRHSQDPHAAAAAHSGYDWSGYYGQQWPSHPGSHAGAWGGGSTPSNGQGWGQGAAAWPGHPPHPHHHHGAFSHHPYYSSPYAHPYHHHHHPPQSAYGTGAHPYYHYHQQAPCYPAQGPYGYPPPQPPAHAHHPQGHGWCHGAAAAAGGQHADGESRWPAGVRHVVREYVKQQSTWQQAYGTWYEQYRQWYEEWQRAGATTRGEGVA